MASVIKKDETHQILYGTAVVIRAMSHPPSAVFLRGLSGTGKSDLAFRLIESGHGLISDDQVQFEKRVDKLYAETVGNIRGLLEVRGVGLFKYPFETESIRLRMVVDLVKREDVPRLPEKETAEIMGVSLPLLKLNAFEASAPLKIVKAVHALFHPEAMVP